MTICIDHLLQKEIIKLLKNIRTNETTILCYVYSVFCSTDDLKNLVIVV
jgi:hypothetical protein